MPASLPGATLAENQGNPTQGGAVIMDPLSGPKGTLFDARTIASWSAGSPVYAADAENCSTGGLSTGIGFGSPPILNPGAFTDRGPFNLDNFTDDYIPGTDLPVGTTATDSKMAYIGGGRSDASGAPVPYDADEVGICMAGNGKERDETVSGGAGYPIKTVTAAGTVANGAAVETGFENHSGVSIVTGQSVFGAATAANAIPA